jgi:hypothetical protein
MLVPFVIDCESLAPDCDWPDDVIVDVYGDLLSQWRLFGLLVHDGNKFEKSKLSDAVQNCLPYKFRDSWLRTRGKATMMGAKGWDGHVVNEPKILKKLSRICRVALVDEERAFAEFDFEEGQRSVCLDDYGGLEICRISKIARSNAFQQALALEKENIVKGELCQDVWNQRFHSLAISPIKTIVLVDRYAVKNLHNCVYVVSSGVARFLRHLNSCCNSKKHLKLISAWPSGLGLTLSDIEPMLLEILSELSSDFIDRITLVMVPDPLMRQDGHDRFIRFGDYAWELTLGFSVLFEEEVVMRPMQATFKNQIASPHYSNTELELERHAKPKIITVRV